MTDSLGANLATTLSIIATCVLYIGSTYWVFNDAKNHGRERTAFVWAVGTLCVPPIFLPIYLFVTRKSKSSIPSNSKEDNNNKKLIF